VLHAGVGLLLIPDTDVVLLGIGHANIHVLHEWRTRPPRGARLTCVSNYAVSTYSGMLPGVLAGQYRPERMEIDVAALCSAAGARLVTEDVRGLDAARQTLLFADHPPLPFDVLSIGIGSVPTDEGVEIVEASRRVPIKPMQTFLACLDERLRDAMDRRHGLPIRVATVGGGAGGVELALCLPFHVRLLFGEDAHLEQTLISGDQRLVPNSLNGTARRIQRVLRRRSVRVIGGRVVRVDGSRLTLDAGMTVEADLILWATGAAAPPLLSTFGLPTDARGFLLTAETLQSTGGAPIFAVGDTGTIAGSSTAKAGVYAVRQGPVLWDNVRRMLAKKPLRRYVPQRGFLTLINTGDGRAIGEWNGISFEGAWCWWLKDYIDSRFMDTFQSRDAYSRPRSP
jgi:selenide, water dikinase